MYLSIFFLSLYLLTYLANIGSLGFEWTPLSSVWTLASSLGPSIYGWGTSNSVWTNLVASECDLGPLDYDSSCTGCNLGWTRDFGDLGAEVSWLSIGLGNVSSS